MSSQLISSLIELSRRYESVSRADVESAFVKIFYHTAYTLQTEIDLCNKVFDYFDDPNFSEEHYIDEVLELLDHFVTILENPNVSREEYLRKISQYLVDVAEGADDGYFSQ